MAEIGVHLENVAVAGRIGQAYLEALDVGGAEAELSGTLMELYTTGKFFLQTADGFGSAVRRTVVDHKHVKLIVAERHHGADYGVDVLDLLVGGYDDYTLMHIGMGSELE